ncbi:MAG: Crp/Fnr family transcriptional regulator [Pseudolabrys sp.]
MPATLMEGHSANRLLAALPSKTLALMAADLRQISIAQGELIYEPGDPMNDVYFPQTGLISLLVVTKDGSAIEATAVGCEGAVGLHRGWGPRRSFTRAAIQIGGKFSTIRANRFEQFARTDEPVRSMIGCYIELCLAEAQQIAVCNAVHDASLRLARWLLQCADRTRSEQLPLTQEFLAQMLNVRRTTVTLMAQELQQKGLIRYSRGKITIHNRKGLEARACDCYPIIRHDRLPAMIGVKI